MKVIIINLDSKKVLGCIGGFVIIAGAAAAYAAVYTVESIFKPSVDEVTLSNARNRLVTDSKIAGRASLRFFTEIEHPDRRRASIANRQADQLQAVVDEFERAESTNFGLQVKLESLKKEQPLTKIKKQDLACAAAINGLSETSAIFIFDFEKYTTRLNIPKQCIEVFQRVQSLMPTENEERQPGRPNELATILTSQRNAL